MGLIVAMGNKMGDNNDITIFNYCSCIRHLAGRYAKLSMDQLRK